MKKRILITSALPYANGPLHFGHIAGAYLPADCYARFERLKGHEVLFISGSDEYGVAITLSAELANRTPQEQADHFHQVNQEIFEKFSISFDHFSRTTTPEHAPLVQQFFNDLLANGYIEARMSEQFYSESDRRFLADRYIVGTCPKCGFEEARGDECQKCGASYESTELKQPRSKLSGATLTLKETEHWFLLFGRFKEELEKLLNARLWKSNVTHFARSYIESLHERAITRDLEWGIPVPLDKAKNKVFYVWFDAPIGYISATQAWAKQQKEANAWKKYWLDPQTHYVQFMGKDNVPFHAMFFPAMILGQNQPYKIVDDLVANEFYNFEGKKFSKSEGWTIDLDNFFRHFHVDQIRYTLAANAPESGDSEFTWRDFQLRCNGELLGKYGNLVNRVLVFLQNKLQAKVPKRAPLEEIDHRFLSDMQRITLAIEESYATYHLRRAAQQIMELAQLGNTYFDAKTPWKVVDSPATQTTLSLCLECIQKLACISYPILSQTAERVWEMLGNHQPLSHFTWNELLEFSLEEGRQLPKPSILFQKIEDEVIEQQIALLQQRHEVALKKKDPPYAPLKPMIGIESVDQLDLRVGLIVAAEKLKKSKKLLQLEVDLGFERRTILSGISGHYAPEELIGKKVIVVANLKPAKLMGVESQGMVLAGSLDQALELATVEGLPAGTSIS